MSFFTPVDKTFREEHAWQPCPVPEATSVYTLFHCTIHNALTFYSCCSNKYFDIADIIFSNYLKQKYKIRFNNLLFFSFDALYVIPTVVTKHGRRCGWTVKQRTKKRRDPICWQDAPGPVHLCSGQHCVTATVNTKPKGPWRHRNKPRCILQDCEAKTLSPKLYINISQTHCTSLCVVHFQYNRICRRTISQRQDEYTVSWTAAIWQIHQREEKEADIKSEPPIKNGYSLWFCIVHDHISQLDWLGG